MNKFAIYSPVLGTREDYPNVLIDKAFMPDNENVQFWSGMVRTAKMRSKEMVRTPYVITVIDTVNKKLTVAGDVTGVFSSGDTIGVYTQITSGKTTRGNFTQDGDAVVNGSTTEITVEEAVTSLTVGDYLYNQEGSVTDNLKVPFPDGLPAIKYHNHIYGSDRSHIFLGFTSTHIYKWMSTDQTWILVHTNAGAATCTQWGVESMNDKVIATNNVEPPIVWDTTGSFTHLDDATYGPEVSTGVYISKAKAVAKYNNTIIFGHVTYSDSTGFQPSGIAWSDLDDETEWDSGDAGTAKIDGAGDIENFGRSKEYLYCFKTKSTQRIWYSGTALIWHIDSFNDSIGCSAYDSIVTDEDDRLYYFSSDFAFREITLGRISQPIVETVETITRAQLGLIKSAYWSEAEYDEIVWSVPTGAGATANNKVVVYKNGKWLFRDMAVTAFGKYFRIASWTWDTLPFSTWDSWGWESWDSADGSDESSVDLCGDADGYTYGAHDSYIDDDSAFTSYFVLSTDLSDKQALPYKKRLIRGYIYAMNQTTGTLSLSVKRDNETDWQSIGSVSLSGSSDILRLPIKIDKAAKHFLLKLSAADPFRFLGMEFEFIPWGER